MFFFKILLAANNISFINSNIFKLAIKSTFFIFGYLLPKLRPESEYNFW